MSLSAPPTILYITGQAYSGSTVLCALLGTHPELEPVSELAKWTSQHGDRARRRCACGRKVLECEFWSAVERGWLDMHGGGLSSYAALQEKFEHISSIWRHGLASRPHPEADFEEYARLTRGLLQAISDQSERPVIVDSSKLPGRALALLRVGGIEIFLVHLVRDGLQFLQSSLRRGKAISTGDRGQTLKAFRLGMDWAATNLAADFVLRRAGTRALRLRYEDLISQPIQSVRSIGALLRVGTGPIEQHISEGSLVNYRHMATGAAYRYQEPRPLLDGNRPLTAINRGARLAFKLGAAAASRRFGYE
jgi:hypothetical protein